MTCPGGSFPPRFHPHPSLPSIHNLPATPKPHFVEWYKNVQMPDVIDFIASQTFRKPVDDTQIRPETIDPHAMTPLSVPTPSAQRNPEIVPSLSAIARPTHSAPGNPDMAKPVKRSLTSPAMQQPTSHADTPPTSPPSLAFLADVALEKENQPRSEQELQQPIEALLPPIKRARPSAPDLSLAPQPVPHSASGIRVNPEPVLPPHPVPHLSPKLRVSKGAVLAPKPAPHRAPELLVNPEPVLPPRPVPQSAPGLRVSKDAVLASKPAPHMAPGLLANPVPVLPPHTVLPSAPGLRVYQDPVLVSHPFPHLAPGLRVHLHRGLAPRPHSSTPEFPISAAPKPAPKPAAASLLPSLIYLDVIPGGILSDFDAIPISNMVSDVILSTRTGQFPSPHFQKIIEANLAFSKRALTPEESTAWQKARDAWLSKALGAYKTCEEVEEKLQALVQMEAQLSQQASHCFRIKELDLTGFIPHCDTLSHLKALEKLSLGYLNWIKDAAKLSNLPVLHHLTIKSCDPRPNEWANFPTLGALKSLSLGECSTLEGRHLQYLPGQIDTLELQNPGCINGQSLPELCRHFRQLQHLKIESASIGPSSDLTPLRLLTRLRSLVLKTKQHSAFGLKRDQVSKLFQPGGFPNLDTMELGRLLEDMPPSALAPSLPAVKTIAVQNERNIYQYWVQKAADPDSTETDAG